MGTVVCLVSLDDERMDDARVSNCTSRSRTRAVQGAATTTLQFTALSVLNLM